MEGCYGQVMVFAGNYAPKNWMFCHGQLLNISEHEILYAVIGTTFGGNGTTTFAIPDFRGRVPVGAGQGPNTMFIPFGSMGGSESFQLSVTQLPSHNHSAQFNGGDLNFNSATASGSVPPKAYSGRQSLTNDPTGNYPAKAPSGTNIYSSSNNSTMGSSPVSIHITDVDMSIENVNVIIGDTGSGQKIYHRSPFIGVNWIICIDGCFPSRN